MSGEPKRVVIVQRHPIVRERLAELVAEDPGLRYVGEADNIVGAAELVAAEYPDLALTGLHFRKGSGLELLKQIKRLSPSTAVLVFSGHDESVYAKRVIAEGAMGFISKDCSGREIVDAIHQVLSGNIHLSPAMTHAMLSTLSMRRIAAPIGRSVTQLSDRELEVLEKIGEGRNTREIANALGLSRASIETYRARIKEKLNLRNACELLSFAIRWFSELN